MEAARAKKQQERKDDPVLMAAHIAKREAFKKGWFNAKPPADMDIDNEFTQDMALIAFLNSDRAIAYTQYCENILGKGKKILKARKSYIVKELDNEGEAVGIGRVEVPPRSNVGIMVVVPIPKINGRDQGVINRKEATELREADNDFGRYVLRNVAELTNADLVGVKGGVNNLFHLARTVGEMGQTTYPDEKMADLTQE